MVRIYSRILCFAFLLFGFAVVPCMGKYGGGAGTAEQPYLIYTAEDMNEIGANPLDWGEHFALMADIDLGIYTAEQFNVIGQSLSSPFKGVFDGRGHVISGFTYESNTALGVGLFGYLGDGGVVKNLGLAEPNVAAFGVVGTVVGVISDGVAGPEQGRIESCWVTGGSVDAMNQKAGGLAGDISGGTVINCYARGTEVTASSVAGGLAAVSDGGVVVNSFAANPVLAPGGGRGGFIGEGSTGVYAGCFYDTQAGGVLKGIGDGNDPCGLTGESTANLKLGATFVDSDWDIVTSDNQPLRNIWRLCEDGVDYPHLAVECLAADFACPDGVNVEDLAAFVDQWLFELLEANVDFDLDRRVTFRDWAVLAAAWRSASGSGNYNPAADIYPAGGDGIIDELDVGAFVQFWLSYGSAYLSADIEPYGGDGVVDFADFAAFANEWLEGDQ